LELTLDLRWYIGQVVSDGHLLLNGSRHLTHARPVGKTLCYVLQSSLFQGGRDEAVGNQN
jgi:hypothetical protein